jgi:hypothetical protein
MVFNNKCERIRTVKTQAMKTTKRFEESATKLYNAFNEGTLNAMECTLCAVGNLCNNETYWSKLHDKATGKDNIPDEVKVKKVTGYNMNEINNIESLFMYGTIAGTNRLWNPQDMTKENQFDGLMAVLNYLAELDNIQSIEQQYNKFKTVIEREKILTEN